MIEIYIEYNPFSLEFIIQQDGKDFYKDSKIHKYKQSRLQNWVDKLIPEIYKVIKSKFNLVFKGTILDYEDIQEEASKFNELKNKEIVTLSYIEIRTVNDRLKELKELFNYMQDTAPFEELKTKDVIKKFDKAINRELEIAAIATISAGKSTLINSLLGKKLLPIKESSCTSTIIKIKDVKGVKNITACFKDNDNNVIETIGDADYTVMEKFNSDSRVSYIDAEADIKFIETNDMNVVLLDTPGPDNAKNEKHKEKTFSVIKEKEPLIIYIFNASDYRSDSDNLLLESVSEVMKKDGKQFQDRFIFVFNQTDLFDIENRDSIKQTYYDIVTYLKNKYEINNPNLYLISAKNAMAIRLMKYDKNHFDEDLESSIHKYGRLTNAFEDFHLSNKYCSINISGKEKIKNMLENALDDNDKLLIHTGVPALEIGINNYLEKYSMPERIKNAVDTFIGYIEEKKIVNNIAIELSNNKKDLEIFREKISFVEKQIESGKKGLDFKEKIKKLDISDKIKNDMEELRVKIGESIGNEVCRITEEVTNNKGIGRFSLDIYELIFNLGHKYSKKERKYIVDKKRGKIYEEKIMKSLSDLAIKFKIDLEHIMTDNIEKVSNDIFEEYKSHIKSLLEELNIDGFNSNLHHIDDIFNQEINNMKKEFDKYVLPKEFKWFVFVRLEDEFNIMEYNGEVLANVVTNIEKYCEEEKEKILNEAEKLKSYYLLQIENLNSLLNKKMAELKDMVSSEVNMQEHIEKNKNSQKWINDFVDRLNFIIEL